MTYAVVKRNKRLWIVSGEELVYTPPDFIRHRLQSRKLLEALASKFNELGRRDVRSIVTFEGIFSNE